MIGRLKGQLADKKVPLILLDVGGVGYEVEVPMSTVYVLPRVGEPLTLLTHLVVRDDAHILYGFASEAERDLFRALIKVNGVGPKLALTILSGASVEEFRRYVHSQDSAALTKLPGVGKKTAERLVMEMRDRLGNDTEAALPAGAIATAQPFDEAQGALIALGYKPAEAAKMLRRIDADGLAAEELIRLALKGAVTS